MGTSGSWTGVFQASDRGAHICAAVWGACCVCSVQLKGSPGDADLGGTVGRETFPVRPRLKRTY